MSRPNKKQLQQEFMAITCSDSTTAKDVLEKYRWDINVAVGHYLDGAARMSKSSRLTFDATEVNKIFSKYQQYDTEKEENIMKAEGMIKLFEDLSMSCECVEILIFAWKCKASVYGQFSREEFRQGCESLGASNFSSLNKEIHRLKSSIENPTHFKDFYEWVFGFIKEPRRPHIDTQSARQHWSLLLSDSYPQLNLFFTFLDERNKKVISRDTWRLFLDFVRTVDANFTQYDPQAAWPVLLDEYVEWVKTNQQVSSNPKNMDVS